MTGLLLLALLGGCNRTCEGEGCECAVDDDCVMGCSEPGEPGVCDCTNGWPRNAEAAADDPECDGLQCAAVECGEGTFYEARCSFGRCVGVPQ